jgi:hypothetical protein
MLARPEAGLLRFDKATHFFWQTTEMEEFLKDNGRIAMSLHADWCCKFCCKPWSEDLGNETLRETSCNGANHCKYVLAWLSSSPAQGQRVEYSRFLDGRILRLDLESDKNEIKSMLFDFVHDKGVNKNSFRSILDRLRELEHKNVKVVLGLAVLKSLAEAESNNEPIRRKAKKLKTMRDIQSLIASRRESWKIHMNAVSASGKVQLVVQLVEPFICRTIGAFPTSPDESSDSEDSDSSESDF